MPKITFTSDCEGVDSVILSKQEYEDTFHKELHSRKAICYRYFKKSYRLHLGKKSISLYWHYKTLTGRQFPSGYISESLMPQRL